MERCRVPFTPSVFLSLSLPPSSLHLPSLVPFQAVFLKPCTKPLTCHHFASLGPLAANPEICTWEAEGVLRSPNQPFFLKGWATSNKGWRRAARSRECWRGVPFWGRWQKSLGGPGGGGGGGGVAWPEAMAEKGAGSSSPRVWWGWCKPSTGAKVWLRFEPALPRNRPQVRCCLWSVGPWGGGRG